MLPFGRWFVVTYQRSGAGRWFNVGYIAKQRLRLGDQSFLKFEIITNVVVPVDEPALASIMTHDHAKDLCASELGPLRI